MKLYLNFGSGTLSLDGSALSFPGMLVSELESSPLHAISASRMQKKKSVFFRFSGDIIWDSYRIESLVVEFNAERCREVHIHLSPISNGDVESVTDLEFIDMLRSNLMSSGKTDGRSMITFPCRWGSVSVVYDIKVSAATVRVTYA